LLKEARYNRSRRII